MKILVNYRADKQFEKRATWYQGVIIKVYCDKSSWNVLYAVDYDDGDFEDGERRENVKRIKVEKGRDWINYFLSEYNKIEAAFFIE